MTKEERLTKVAELKRTLWAQGVHRPAVGGIGEHVAKTTRPEEKSAADVPADDVKLKIKGMLWGLLVGDALGSPIQFSSKDSHPWITDMVPCGIFSVGPGCWTDDGSMALCVMDSVVRKGGYDL